MLKVSGLEKSYGRQVIFDNVSFVMNPGERIGLVGRNGHGKTTLFKMILGEEEPDSAVISIPNYYTIGHLSQHIRFTEDTVLKEGCISLPVSDDGIDESYKVKSILMGLGFSTDDFDRSPSMLSGGYQIRLNLAKVLVSEPNLLLLDEPTNYLDIVSVRWLTRFLRNWKGELIIITHDREFMDSVTTHTMGIHRCKMKKIAGPTQKFYQQIAQEEEIHEKTRIGDERKRAEVGDFINRFRAKASKAKAVQSRVKALLKMEKLDKLSDIRTLDFSFKSAPFPGKWLMNAANISFSYHHDSLPLINGLDIAVGKNDRIAIIGKNGKGKTTLLSILAGELQPQTGAVQHNQNLSIAYFGQTNINRLNPQKTVEMEIMDTHSDCNMGAGRKICGIMMFDGDKALKKIEVLSGGEKSRVLLGKLLVTPANLLLLDEPTNHLDMDSIDSMVEAIEAFDGGVIIVTHSEMILNSVATRLIVFDNGKVELFEGTYQEFLDQVGWESERAEEADNSRPISKQNNNINKKEMRRRRSQLNENRSKILGPLQKMIAAVEKSIMFLEKDVENESRILVEASEKGDGETISTASVFIHKLNSQIETLFKELESLTSEHDAKSKEFEQRMIELISPDSSSFTSTPAVMRTAETSDILYKSS
ncbi:MAG: ABC-F family ATP-binding cassette domain-containing protein [Deltaproteobacteria bacterium]|nr:ABC-F family ATP-binding cassette domain-containing protein [Deltaproteobacteria bacterium]